MVAKIIAEVASNHKGDISLAKEFIRVAARTGVDCVKFQSSRYEDLVDKNECQAEWVKSTSISDEAHFELIEECKKNRVQFLTTCFSIIRVDFLASLGLEQIKVASPDLLSFPMIDRLSQHFEHLIISTGMHSKKEIKIAIDFLLKNGINATLLHAVSIYPTPIDATSMYKFLWLKDSFPHVGYSHHSAYIEPIKFAMAHGVDIVEAHMKLGEDGPGRTTPWDILPRDFEDLARYRNTLSSMLGNEECLREDEFLLLEEAAARKQFIGRWGNNR